MRSTQLQKNPAITTRNLAMGRDILDDVLNLEDTSYQEGYEEGKEDGVRAGLEEGTVFGLEQGYKKAIDMGKLHGRAMMLNACLSRSPTSTVTSNIPGQSSQSTSSPPPPPPPPPPPRPPPPGSAPTSNRQSPTNHATDPSKSTSETILINLPTIPENSRLQRHIDTLLKLTDPSTINPTNSDEAIEEFDDRTKKAVAKAKVIDKIIGPHYGFSVSGNGAGGATSGQEEAAALAEEDRHANRLQERLGVSISATETGTGNIEELDASAVRR